MEKAAKSIIRNLYDAKEAYLIESDGFQFIRTR